MAAKRWTKLQIEAMRRSRLVANLSNEIADSLRKKTELVDFKPTDMIIEQGQKGEDFYIVVKGNVAVSQKVDSQSKELAVLSEGDYFGEQALLGNANGHISASIIAQTDCRLAKIDKNSFYEFLEANEANRKIFDETLLVRCPPIAALAAASQASIVEASITLSFDPHEDIVVQDDIGDAFYVIVKGEVEVIRMDESGTSVHLVDLGAGSYFGEQALLGQSQGRRAASVRAKTECRVLEIKADTFATQIASSNINKERFESDASRYVYEQMSKSLDAFADSELGEGAQGVSKVSLEAGTELVGEGDPSDSAYLLTSGTALVVQSQGNDFRELARLGAGQILGEKGVLESKPRAATVIAETDIEALRIEADVFQVWHAKNPNASDFFKSLSQVYSLSQGRKLSLFMGDVDGAQTVTSVVGKPSDGIVSTRVLGQGVVVFSNKSADAKDGEREVLVYSKDDMRRELRVLVTARKKDKIDRCIVYGVSAEGIENDLGTLYQHVAQLDEVPAVALRRFERTGFLGAQADKNDRICPCLGFSTDDIAVAALETDATYEILQANFGVGSICGGCERAVRDHLNQDNVSIEASAKPSESQSIEVDNSVGDVNDVPTNQLTKDERQLSSLLRRGMGPDTEHISKQQLAIRLRSNGVRDMDRYLDILFPNAFNNHTRATYNALAAAVGRGMGFGPWRETEQLPKSLLERKVRGTAQWIYKLPHGTVPKAIGLFSALLLVLSRGEALLPLSLVANAGLGLWIWLRSKPTGRIVLKILMRGPDRLYSAIFEELGDETILSKLALGANGTSYMLRDEQLIDDVLQKPDLFARNPILGYPPFGAHSQLGGGSGGVWLGYRVLFEEYFAEGYREDIDEMREIVRERIAMWRDKSSINLLEEIYKIIVELRGRIFFQTSFNSFDDTANINMPQLVDQVLSMPTFGLGDELDGGAKVLQDEIVAAVKKSTRDGSVGRILLDAWREGDLNELELKENAVLYVLAQAPTMGIFWTLYRSAVDGCQNELRTDRRELVKAIKEELRLHAPVTMMFRRKITQDTKLGRQEVRQGEGVVLCPMYIHTNPAQWTDPMQHDRHRWSAATGDATEVVEPTTDKDDASSRPSPLKPDSAPARYLPFGGGSQACQGRWFAADEIHSSFLFKILRIFPTLAAENVRGRGGMEWK